MCTQQIQQQYSSSTSRGECCRSTENFFFYSRVTPGWGGTATNVPTKMYCCVLLCTTNKSGGGRATAGERCMCTQQVQQQYSTKYIAVRVWGSVVRVHKIFFFIHESPWGGAATNVPTKMYCCVLLCTTNKSGGGRATAGEQESNTYR